MHTYHEVPAPMCICSEVIYYVSSWDKIDEVGSDKVSPYNISTHGDGHWPLNRFHFLRASLV